MKKFLVGLLAAFLAAAGGYAVAQQPSNLIASPTGSEQISVLGLSPQNQQILLKQSRDSVGYQISAATSGAVTFGTSQSQLQLSASSTISTLTIALTQVPSDGQMNCFYGISAITTLTMSAAAGQTINNALTSTSAATRYCYAYSLSTLAWNRFQ